MIAEISGAVWRFPHILKRPMRRTNIHRALYHAAMTFRAVSPRLPFKPKDFLLLRVLNELESHPLVMTVTEPATAGGEPGILVLRGPLAIAQMMTLASEGRATSQGIAALDLMSCTFEPARALGEPARGFLRRAVPHLHSDAVVPAILVKPSDEPLRGPTVVEVKLLHFVIRAVLQAAERGWLGVDGLLRRDGSSPVLFVSGDPLAPELSVSLDTSGGGQGETEPRPSMTLPRDALRRVSRHQQSWLVGCPMAPVALTGSDEPCRLLLLLDRRGRKLIDGRPITGARWDFAAADALLDIIIGAAGRNDGRGLPSQILFAERELAQLLCPELRLLGLSCRHEPNVDGPITASLETVVEWLCAAIPGRGRGGP
jgi:hypothetical protein